MQEKNTNLTTTNVDDNKQSNVKKITPSHKKKKSANEDFKRKYFDYYDDIKISDRQDW